MTLAWLQWNHPSMPWDDVELRTRNLVTGEEIVVAGGRGESVSEPQLAAGRLALVHLRPHRLVEPLPLAARAPTSRPWCGMEAEIGVPRWVFGSSRYAVLADGRVVFARRRNGLRRPGRARPDGRSPSWTCRSR